MSETTPVNPFAPESAPGVQVIILMRIYDVLMALLQESNEEMHDKLDALHESGQVAWSLPYLDLKARPEDDPSPTDESEESVPGS